MGRASILAGVLAFAVGSQVVPPQLRSIETTYDRATVRFWYPSFYEVQGSIRFGMEFKLSPDSSYNLAHDELRNHAYLCGTHSCPPLFNELRRAWIRQGEKIEDIDRTISNEEDRLQQNTASIQFVDERISDLRTQWNAIKPPPLACTTQSEESTVALTYCTIKYAGPKICKDEFKKFMPEEISSRLRGDASAEICQMAINGVLGDKYNIFDAAFSKYYTNLDETLVKEFFKWLDEDVGEMVDWGFIINKVVDCMPAAASRCRRVASRWQEEAESLRNELRNAYAGQDRHRTSLLAAKYEIERKIDTLRFSRKSAIDERNVIETQRDTFVAKGEIADLHVKLFGS